MKFAIFYLFTRSLNRGKHKIKHVMNLQSVMLQIMNFSCHAIHQTTVGILEMHYPTSVKKHNQVIPNMNSPP